VARSPYERRAGRVSRAKREKSEERIEQDFDLQGQIRGVPRGCDPLVGGRKPEKGRQGAKRTLEGGKRSCSPSKVSIGEIAA